MSVMGVTEQEYWNNGMLEIICHPNIPLFHHSIIPFGVKGKLHPFGVKSKPGLPRRSHAKTGPLGPDLYSSCQ